MLREIHYSVVYYYTAGIGYLFFFTTTGNHSQIHVVWDRCRGGGRWRSGLGVEFNHTSLENHHFLDRKHGF